MEILIFCVVIGFELVDRLTSGLIAELATLILFLSLVLILEGSKKYLIAVFMVPFLIFYVQFSSERTYRETLHVWHKKTLGVMKKNESHCRPH